MSRWRTFPPVQSSISLVLALSMMGATAGVVAAGTQGSCDSGDSTRAKLFVNIISDNSDGDDVAWQCVWKSNLANKSHTLPGNCNDGGLGQGSWNDCISSVKPWTPSGKRLCIYEDSGYTGSRQGWNNAKQGVRYDLSSLQDKVSSINWVNGGTCYT